MLMRDLTSRSDQATKAADGGLRAPRGRAHFGRYERRLEASGDSLSAGPRGESRVRHGRAQSARGDVRARSERGYESEDSSSWLARGARRLLPPLDEEGDLKLGSCSMLVHRSLLADHTRSLATPGANIDRRPCRSPAPAAAAAARRTRSPPPVLPFDVDSTRSLRAGQLLRSSSVASELLQRRRRRRSSASSTSLCPLLARRQCWSPAATRLAARRLGGFGGHSRSIRPRCIDGPIRWPIE